MKRMDKTKKYRYIVLLIAIMFSLFVSCSASSELLGSITVEIGEANSRTIRPDTEKTTIVKHVIKGYLNSDISFSQECFGNECVVDNLIAGTWTVYVEGINVNGIIVAVSETKNIEVLQNQNTSASFSLDYISDGRGSMDVTIEIPYSESTIDKVVGKITPVTEGLEGMEFTVERSSATKQNDKLCFNKKANLSVGSYRISFNMYDEENNQIGKTLEEVLYIFRDQVSQFSWYWDKDYVPPVAPPIFDLVEGTYFEGQLIRISNVDPDASIYYTTDGSTPDKSAIEYSDPIILDRTMEIKAIAIKEGLVDSEIYSSKYIAKVKTPIIALSAGTYTSEQETSITCATEGAAIHYSLDGSSPSTSSLICSSTIPLTRNATLKVVATKEGLEDSEIVSGSYVFQCLPPVFNVPDNQLHNNAQNLRLSTSTSGAKIYYTTDSTDPTTASSQYSTTIVLDGNVTVKAATIKDGWNSSDVVTKAYSFKCADPVFKSESGSYTSLEVGITSATNGSTIYYTSDGSNPIDNGKVFEAFTLDRDSIYKACAKKDGYEPSNVVSAEYWISPQNSTINILQPKGDDFKISKPQGWFSGMYLLANVEATLSISTASQIDSFCWYYDGRKLDVDSTSIKVGGSDADIPLVAGGHSIGAKIVIGDRSFSETLYYVCINEYNGEPGCVSWGDITLYGIGPAGGYVIYDVDADNDVYPYSNQDGLESERIGWRYIEVAPHDLKIYGGLPSIEDVVGTVSTFCFGLKRDSADGENLFSNGSTLSYDDIKRSKIGQSVDNTKLIVDGYGEYAYQNEIGSQTTTVYAAAVVDRLVSHNPYGLTFDDWALPSSEDIAKANWAAYRNEIPKLTSSEYWTSTEDSEGPSYALYSCDRDDGTPFGGSISKAAKMSVRPVRYF